MWSLAFGFLFLSNENHLLTPLRSHSDCSFVTLQWINLVTLLWLSFEDSIVEILITIKLWKAIKWRHNEITTDSQVTDNWRLYCEVTMSNVLWQVTRWLLFYVTWELITKKLPWRLHNGISKWRSHIDSHKRNSS